MLAVGNASSKLDTSEQKAQREKPETGTERKRLDVEGKRREQGC